MNDSENVFERNEIFNSRELEEIVKYLKTDFVLVKKVKFWVFITAAVTTLLASAGGTVFSVKQYLSSKAVALAEKEISMYLAKSKEHLQSLNEASEKGKQIIHDLSTSVVEDLRVNKITIQSVDGKKLIVLGVSTNSHGVELFDNEEKLRLVVGLNKQTNTPAFAMNDNAGNTRFAIKQFKNNNVEVQNIDSSGTTRIRSGLFSDDMDPKFFINGKNGNTRICLYQNGNEQGMDLSGPKDGKIAFRLKSSKDKNVNPYWAFFDKDGDKRVETYVNTLGYVATSYYSAGKRTITIGSGQGLDGFPQISFFDNDVNKTLSLQSLDNGVSGLYFYNSQKILGGLQANKTGRTDEYTMDALYGKVDSTQLHSGLKMYGHQWIK